MKHPHLAHHARSSSSTQALQISMRRRVSSLPEGPDRNSLPSSGVSIINLNRHCCVPRRQRLSFPTFAREQNLADTVFLTVNCSGTRMDRCDVPSFRQWNYATRCRTHAHHTVRRQPYWQHIHSKFEARVKSAARNIGKRALYCAETVRNGLLEFLGIRPRHEIRALGRTHEQASIISAGRNCRV
jgi:hypothetical protein